jgi:sporulation protein YlmC with PRC-barrel domain
MMRLTDVLGCRVVTRSGRRIGHVYDVRVARRAGSSKNRADQQWRVEGLLIGTRGLFERIGVRTTQGREPIRNSDVVPWEAVTRVRNGEIVVDDDRLGA